MTAGRVWAITSFFNPMRYRSRIANYRAFREHLPIPLCAVELANHGEFQLGDEDAEIVVRASSPDIIWQKERLLNLALTHLPPEAEIVVWLDCDLVIPVGDWPDQVAAALRDVPIVQCYAELFDLSPGESPAALDSRRLPSGISVAWSAHNRNGVALSDPMASSSDRRRASPGGAWAARRTTIEEIGFYDAMVVGGADRPFAHACFGTPEEAVRIARMTEPQAAHYRPWAARVATHVGGRVGVVDLPLLHLWHGAIADRQYSSRHQRVAELGFDPGRDIVIGPTGAWQWAATAGEALKNYVADYFRSRREDGTDVAPPVRSLA